MLNKIFEVTGQKEAYDFFVSQKKQIAMQILGLHGSGKSFLTDEIKKKWATNKKNIILEIAPNKRNTTSYNYASIINSLSFTNNNIKDRLGKVLQAGISGVPYAGEMLNSIIFGKKTFPTVFNEVEAFIISKILNIAKGKKLLLIIKDYSNLDFETQCLIQKVIKFKLLSSSSIIFTNEVRVQNDVLHDQNTFCLKKLSIKDFCNCLLAFGVNKQLTEEQVKSLYKVTDGNLGFIKIVCNSIRNNTIENLVNTDSLFESLIKNLTSDINNPNQVIEFLDKAAFLGQVSQKKLLSLFSEFSLYDFNRCLLETFSHEILLDQKKYVEFVNRFTFLLFSNNIKNRFKYHFKLLECVKILFPCNHEMKAKEYFECKMFDEAAISYIIHLLEFVRVYRKPIDVPEDFRNIIQEYGYGEYLEAMISAYIFYFSFDFNNALKNINKLHINNNKLNFEIEYLNGLIGCTMETNNSCYEEVLLQNEKWIESDELLKDEPELWIRAALISHDIMFETRKLEEQKALFNKIERVINLYCETDVKMLDKRYNLYFKASTFCKVETSLEYIEKALQYIQTNYSNRLNIFDYYSCLVNCAAHNLILGSWDAAIHHSKEAIELIGDTAYISQSDKIASLNNFCLGVLFKNGFTNSDLHFFEKVFLSLPKQKDLITNILVRNNTACIQCLLNNKQAISIINELFGTISINEDINDYYKYLIFSNYLMINHFFQAKIDYSICEQLKTIVPSPKDDVYFKKRTYLVQQVINRKIPLNSKDDLLSAFGVEIGKAWFFWGKPLLFSDMEFWID